MEQLSLSARKRNILGNNASFKLKKEGKVPAEIYGNSVENVSLELDGREILSIINNKKATNAIIDLKIEGEDEARKVILKDYQTDPVRNRLLHVDLYQMDMNKEVSIVVAVKLTGTPKGIKNGGLLEQIMREVEVKCLPSNFPENIEVDVSGLDVGENLHLRDVSFPEGVKPITELKRTVAVVVEPETEKAEGEETEEAVETVEK
jgi:large subunit ribosomal protein L25